MKKICKLLLVAMIFFMAAPINVTVYASEIENDYIVEINDEYVFVDEQGFEHRYFDGEMNPIKVEDLNSYQIKIMSSSNNIRRVPVGPPDTVGVVSASIVNGTRKKVSPDVAGPANITYGESITTTGSITGGLSGSIQARIIKAIEIKLNVSVSYSSSSSANFAISFPVPSGKIGAVYFTPYLSQSNVNYYDVNGNCINVSATLPVITSAGFTDGLYELVTRNA